MLDEYQNEDVMLHEHIKRLQNVRGTLLLENIELSDQSIDNLNRYFNREVTSKQLLDEIVNRYKK